MEYNLDGVAPAPKPNPFKRFWNSITSANYSRTVGLLLFLLIAAAVPFTAYIAQQQTNTQQQAATSGDVIFTDQNGTPLPSSVSDPNVHLKIALPDNWSLASSKSPIDSFANQSLIKKAYAAACGGTCVCDNQSPPSGSIRTSDTCPQDCPQSEDGDGSFYTPTKLCYSTGGGGGAPTATPQPTQLPSGTARCTSLTVSPANTAPGSTVDLTLRYSGNPSSVKIWVADNSSIGKTNLDQISWTKAIEDTISGGGVKSMRLPLSQFDPGSHLITTQLLASSGDVLDERRTACNATVVIESGGQPAATPTTPGGGIAAPTLHSPANGATVDPGPLESTSGGQMGKATLGWDAPSGAVKYNIRVSNETHPQEGHPANSEFSNNCTDAGRPNYVCVNGFSGRTYLTIYVRPGDRYTWWVHAIDANNTGSPASAAFSFSVGGTPPPTPSPTPGGGGGGSKTIATIFIANVDAQGVVTSGGHIPVTISKASEIRDFITTPHWWNLVELGTSENSATRNIVVKFTATDGTEKNVFKGITLTKPTTPVTPPAGTVTIKSVAVACDPTNANKRNIILSWDPVSGASSYRAVIMTGSNILETVCAQTTHFGFNVPAAGSIQNITPHTQYNGVVTAFASSNCSGTVLATNNRLQNDIACQGPTPPTGSPVPSPTGITPPPPGPADVTITLSLIGLGPKIEKGAQVATWNRNPKRPQRDLIVYLYEPGVDPSNDPEGTRAKVKAPQPQSLVYDGISKFVARNFNLGQTFIAGDYQVFVKTPGYLRRRIPGVQKLATGNNTITQQATLSLGDANNDNKLNIQDYQTYLSCINNQTADCIAKADFNDDGEVDKTAPTPKYLDHALFTDQFSIIDGD